MTKKTQNELDQMFLKLKEADVEIFLEKHANIDFITGVIPKAIVHPKFYVFI
jgi:hypothetical protein